MSEDNKLVAAKRDNFGKGAARKLRAVGQVPAVLYGHGIDPIHISLPSHEVSLIIRKANALLELDIDGKAQLALVKDVQRDPVRQILEHLDLLVVKKGEKVIVDVAVLVEGETAPGTMAVQDAQVVSVETEATHIPTSFTLDISGAEEGTQFLAGQIELPKGVTLTSDAEALVVNVISDRPAETAEESEAAAGEVAEAPAAE